MTSNNVCSQTPKPKRDARIATALEERGRTARSSLRSALARAYEYALYDLQLAQVYRARAGLEPDPLLEERE